jgi:predicted nucleotidyltransferase
LTENFDLRHRVAREAASLLYFGAEEEYKQAKQHAAQTFGTNYLPSNLEVALELDKVAEENEGAKRSERLVLMRQEALKVMRVLSKFCPVLIGSVWRGTIKRGSDIDITIYTDNPEEALFVLREAGFRVSNASWMSVNKGGATLESYHIYVQTTADFSLEIVARGLDQAKLKRRCDTFGDIIKGLTIAELEKVMQTNPTDQFIPS